MRNVLKREGTWWVRINVPADLQEEWGKIAEWRSLKTANELDAITLAPPIIREIKERIAQMRRSETTVETKPAAHVQITPSGAAKLIEHWRDSQIHAALLRAYNGQLEALDGPGEAARTKVLEGLSMEMPRAVTGFDARHAEALGVATDHPALPHSARQFADAWLEVEVAVDRFRLGGLERWLTEPGETGAHPGSSSASVRAAETATQLSLSKLLERFVASQNPAEEADLRYAWRRLIEFTGDIDVDQLTPEGAEEWVLAIKRFPVVRQPAAMAKDMRTILAEHAATNVLAPKTVWKWAGMAHRVYSYAERMKLCQINPFAAVMPKKPGKQDQKKKRRSYTASEIELIFSSPLFTGFSGRADAGYREAVGDLVVKDAKYWIPIFALLHGCRLEEIGGSKLSEVLKRDGVDHFDWRARKLKTPEASRELPIHPSMRKLGFFDYIDARRQAGDTYLFPELPHDPQGLKSSTAQFGKWWALWSDARGLASADVDFHSFRHTFIEACRGKMDEETRDFLVGHKGQGSMGRAYGGAPLKVLAKSLARVSYPTFPK